MENKKYNKYYGMRIHAKLTTTETTETSRASAHLNEKENKKYNKYYGIRVLLY
jgi:hypothetical protein